MNRTHVARTLGALGLGIIIVLFQPVVAGAVTSLLYTFNSPGTLYESPTAGESTSPYLWVDSGGKLVITANGVGETIQGTLPAGDPWRLIYNAKAPGPTDNGTHPQNIFLMFSRSTIENVSSEVYLNRVKDNLSNPANRQPYIGEMILARYKDKNNYYYGGIRADGGVVIKKKTNGTYQTLASKSGLFPGKYDKTTAYNLIPLNKWIGLKFVVTNDNNGDPVLTLYTDVGKTGTWKQALSVVDDSAKYGPPITGAGLVGVESDYADTRIDDFLVEAASGSLAPTPTPTPSPTPAPTPKSPSAGSSYDSVVLGDKPVMYLTMGSASSGSESDKTGNGHNGTYKGGTPSAATMPNGDKAAAFNGSSQYLTVPSHSALSIPTTKTFTWEGWIRPDTLQFANASGDEYVDWMGKCQDYSPTCEWEARMYSTSNPEDRPNRLSAYVFNPGAGLGSGSDWQPVRNLIQSGQWLHVVAEYQTTSTPSGCNSAYPGTINIWVNGVKQSFADHAPTGCMSQYKIIPKAGNSPLNIGTMSMDTWFKGAVGKVAVYNRLLSQSEITEHYSAMTGKSPTGSCGDTCSF